MRKIYSKVLAVALSSVLVVGNQSLDMLAIAGENSVDTQENVFTQDENFKEIDLSSKCDYEPLEVNVIDVDESVLQEANDKVIEQNTTLYYAKSSPEEIYWKSLSSDYIYNQLSAEEKKLWDDLESKCLELIASDSYADKVSVSGNLGSDTFNKAVRVASFFREANPQYYFLNSSVGVGTYGGSNAIITLYLYNSFKDGSARRVETNNFRNKVDSWVSVIKQAKYEGQREKIATELICDNTVYRNNEFSQSAYSVFCVGESVCAGYSQALNILLNAVGIETLYVTGSGNGGSHAWNVVNIHNQWYLSDVTWMDQNDEKKSGYFYGINYKYLDKSAKTMSDHVIDDDYKRIVPKTDCDSFYNLPSYDYGYHTPYFDKNGYSYFKINDNSDLGQLKALVIDSSKGNMNSAPSRESYDGYTYTIIYNEDADVNDDINKEETEVKIFSISEDNLTLSKGENHILNVICDDDHTFLKDGVQWSSSNENVAKVSSQGIVTSLKGGKCEIRATVGNDTYICKVSVLVPLTGITLTKNEVSLTSGGVGIVRVVYNEEDTTDDKTVLFSSSNEKVATVNEDGVITAYNNGTAIVTAKVGNCEATCKVTVGVPLTGISIDRTSTAMMKNETQQLKIKYNENNTTDDKSVTWKSLNEKIAVVDNNGNVKAVGKGQTKVIATVGNYSAECTVSVYVNTWTSKIGLSIEYGGSEFATSALNFIANLYNEINAKISKEYIMQKVADKDVKAENIRYEVLNINVLSDNGDVVEPNEEITHTYQTSQDFEDENCKLYYVNDDDSYTQIDLQYEDGKLTFSTKYLGDFVLVNQELLTGTAMNVITGDVNQDGKTDSVDVTIMARYLAASEDMGKKYDIRLLDLNNDTKVDSMDFAIMKSMMVGK